MRSKGEAFFCLYRKFFENSLVECFAPTGLFIIHNVYHLHVGETLNKREIEEGRPVGSPLHKLYCDIFPRLYLFIFSFPNRVWEQE